MPDLDDVAVLYFVYGFTVQLDPDDRSRDIRRPPQRYGACPACHAAIQAHDLDALVRRHLEGARRQAGAPSVADLRFEDAVRQAFGAILQQIDEHRPPVARERILQAAAVLDVDDLVTVWDWPPVGVRRD